MKFEDFNEAYRRIDFDSLYRQFTSRSHLEEFLSGDIRLGHYYYYKHGMSSLNPRFNNNEGSFKNVIINNGKKTRTIASSGGLYPIYSACFSKIPTENLGRFTIKLNNPMEFHKRINHFLKCNENSNYAGNMVYLNSLQLDDECNDSRFMHLYSDSLENSSKQEFRFSYDIFPMHKTEMLESGALTIENNFYKNYQYIPYFIHIKGLKVDDLVLDISS